VSRLTPLPFWVLATDEEVEGEWTWPDGQALTYEPWHENEPNDYGGEEDCATTNWFGKVRWNDIGCGGRFGFICEFPEPSAPEPVEAADEKAHQTGPVSPVH